MEKCITMRQKNDILRWARDRGVFRTREASERGVTRATLSRLVTSGELERIDRGIYRRPDSSISENHTLALVSKRVDNAVVCLLSALSFHGLTTQLPSAVWIALAPERGIPKFSYPSIEVTFMKSSVLEHGVETHQIEGVEVRVTTAAKTVADCFKHRNKIGLEVAIEALRDFWWQRKGSVDELWRAAQVCRIANVIKPYLEAIVG